MDDLELEVSATPDLGETDSSARSQSFGRWVLETVVLVAVAFAAAQAVKTFVVQPYLVPTGSMIPTIQIGDRVFAEKITYRFIHPPIAGDVVVFSDPLDEHPQLIKRVIATEGQTVDVRDNAVFVDGRELEEPYVNGEPTVSGTVELPVKVPEDYVWLMGDNRPNSADSRYFGPRPVSSVHGRAFWTYWPLSAFGRLDR